MIKNKDSVNVCVAEVAFAFDIFIECTGKYIMFYIK